MRGTHAEKTELEPFRKGYQVNLRRSGNPAISKPFMSLSVSWVVMQGTVAAEGSGTPTGWSCRRPYLRFAMGWRRKCQPTSSLGMWLVHMCDSPFLLVDTPDPNIQKLCLRLWLTKRLLPHHPSRDFATSSNGKLMKKWVNRIGQCLGVLIIRPRAERLLRTVPDH